MLLTTEQVPKNQLETHPSFGQVGHYTGVNSFLADVAKLGPPAASRFRNASQQTNKYYAFHSFQLALDMFTKRQKDLVKFVRNEMKLVNPDEIGTDHWYDETGDFLDIGRYLDGEPECFGNMFLGNPRRTFVTLLVKLDVPWSAEVSYLAWYAGKIMRLVDWLEARQVRTRVLAYSATEMDYIEITLKEPYEPLHLGHIAVALNPDFYRRMIFRVREQSPLWDASYGSCEDVDAFIAANFKKIADKDGSILFYFDRAKYENNIPLTEGAFAGAEEWMQKMIAKEERVGSFLV